MLNLNHRRRKKTIQIVKQIWPHFNNSCQTACTKCLSNNVYMTEEVWFNLWKYLTPSQQGNTNEGGGGYVKCHILIKYCHDRNRIVFFWRHLQIDWEVFTNVDK